MAELILRDYQAEFVDGIRAAWTTYRSVCGWLPTGGGKTEVSVHLAQAEAESGGCTLFVVERKTLAAQAQARYSTKYGMLTGLIRGEDTFVRGYEPAVVASIQSLRSRWEHPEVRAVLERVSLICVDEAHIRFDHHTALLDHLPHARVLGLTATPLREGLGLTYETLVKGPSYEHLIGAGHLVRPRYFLPHTVDLKRGLDGVGVSSTGDYVTKDLSALMRKRTIIGDLVSTWQQKAQGRPTIVFAVDIAHSKETCGAFLAAGIAAEHIDMHTTEEERSAIFARFRRGQTKVLCSIVVLAVGFDEPVASCAILARPTLSRIMHIQQIGRVMRTHPDKGDCIVLDHAANVVRHGKVEEFDPPPLDLLDKTADKAKRTGDTTDYFPCPACSALMAPGQRVCAECGHEIARRNTVDFVPGDLTEEPSGPHKGKTREQLHQLYLELRAVALMRGYSDGWAFIKLRETYGFKAPWAWKSEPVEEPSAETLRLVKSWQIAYAKAMQKARRYA
ncbi:MAG: DEAD/DEAH box helicase family protein [Chromatiaceae bacterium]|jgi:superfamily II DNA or RNA helicase|nr:DEAD/DEAH box helicase family protein [Chromatiaceae bacterium]